MCACDLCWYPCVRCVYHFSEVLFMRKYFCVHICSTFQPHIYASVLNHVPMELICAEEITG